MVGVTIRRGGEQGSEFHRENHGGAPSARQAHAYDMPDTSTTRRHGRCATSGEPAGPRTGASGPCAGEPHTEHTNAEAERPRPCAASPCAARPCCPARASLELQPSHSPSPTPPAQSPLLQPPACRLPPARIPARTQPDPPQAQPQQSQPNQPPPRPCVRVGVGSPCTASPCEAAPQRPRLGPSLQNVPARHSSDEAQPSPWSMGSLTYFVEVLGATSRR